MRWIALFSQTGSELGKLAHEFDKWPCLTLTNNKNYEQWVNNISPAVVSIMDTNAINNYLREIEPAFITLHGYLRILPDDICERHEIYNGHPALITHYPELKGKDPQERTWDNKEQYPIIGSVVHRCTAELDGGEVVKSVSYVNRCSNKEELYNKLKESSFIAWKFFLKGRELHD
jgi:folate-dependent phosphoribosylglycinamide formyltransferase PurN